MTRDRKFAVALVLLSVGFAGVLLAAGAATRKANVFEQLDLLVDVRHELVSQYVEKPDETKMIEAAVRAMVQSLEDPYTVYLPPEDMVSFDESVKGSFGGIGAEVEIFQNRLRIVTPLEGSPAWKTGILAGDVVLEVDGVSTEGMSIGEAIRRLKGPEGTKVKVLVRHVSGEEATLHITRARIEVATVKGLRRRPDQHWDYLISKEPAIGYVRITQFVDKTAADLRAALERLREQKVRGVILDLRFNPGGLLGSAIEVSDMFLPAGQRIVSVKGRVVPEKVTLATAGGPLEDVPVVVLANEGSASAAEIVTGALADNARAQFVGTRTFGKGSVQQVRALEDGLGAVKITNAYYYLPNGRNIHRTANAKTWGVDPSDGYYLPMTVEQTREMLRIRREGEILGTNHEAGNGRLTPASIEADLADPQLAGAFKALLGRLSEGHWTKVGLDNSAAQATEARRAQLQRQRDLLIERLDEIEKELGGVPGTQPATRPATQPASRP